MSGNNKFMRFWQLAQRANKTIIPYSDEHESILDAVFKENYADELSHDEENIKNTKFSNERDKADCTNPDNPYPADAEGQNKHNYELTKSAVPKNTDSLSKRLKENKSENFDDIEKNKQPNDLDTCSIEDEDNDRHKNISDKNIESSVSDFLDDIIMTPEELMDEKSNKDSDDNNTSNPNTEEENGENNSKTVPECLIIIDEGYPDLEETVQMMEGLGSIHIINSLEDPLRQVYNLLASLKYVASLHIFAKVAPGCLYLGGKDLFIDTLNSQENLMLRSWGEYFSKHGIVYIYDSEFVSTSTGREAKNSMEILLGVSVIIPDSEVGISIEPVDIGDSWTENDPIEEEKDILSLLLDRESNNAGIEYCANILSKVAINCDVSSINNPIIIVELQVSDGILLLNNSEHIAYIQRPQIGPKIVVKGETTRLVKAFQNIKLLSSNQDSVVVRLTALDINNKIIKDITVVARNKIETIPQQDDFDIYIHASNFILNSIKDRVFITIDSKSDIIDFDKIPILYFVIPGAPEILVFKKHHSSNRNRQYVCRFLSIGYPVSEIVLSNESYKDLRQACNENNNITINKTCTIIIDTSENYAPQLIEGDWSQASISSQKDYAVAGDYINIDILFAEPIYIKGKPKIIIKLGEQEQKAIYTGISGIVLNQKLRFQYLVKRYDVALEGISITRIEASSTALISGLTPGGTPGINVDINIISSKRCSKVKVCDQYPKLINKCVIENELYDCKQLEKYINEQKDGVQITPKISLDEIFATFVNRKFHLVVARSWDINFNEKIHLIQYNSRLFADGGYFGKNSWNQQKYQPLLIDKEMFSGFVIDVFAVNKGILPLKEATLDNILLELKGYIVASARFAYCQNSDTEFNKRLSGVTHLYNSLGLIPELYKKDPEQQHEEKRLQLKNKDNKIKIEEAVLHSKGFATNIEPEADVNHSGRLQKNLESFEYAYSHQKALRKVVTQFKALILPDDS